MADSRVLYPGAIHLSRSSLETLGLLALRKIGVNGTVLLSWFTAAYVVCVISYLVFVGKGFDPYDLDRPEQALGYANSYLYALYAAGFLPWILLGLTNVFEKPVSNLVWIVLSVLGFGSVVTAAYLIMRL